MSAFVYGRHPVHHLLKSGRRKARHLYFLKGQETDAAILALCRKGKVPVTPRETNYFRDKLGEVLHQGLLLESDDYPLVQFDQLLPVSSLLLLDGLNDPQNFGALCRSAYLMGIEGVVIPERRSVAVTPTVCRASAGAVEYLKIATVTSLPQALGRLKEVGFWIYGADMTGDRLVFEEKFPQKTALVLGGEGKGLGRLVRERCDILLRIPMSDADFGAYNASVAGAVLMYEWVRQKMCQVL